MKQLTHYHDLVGKTVERVVERDRGTLLVFTDDSFAVLLGFDDESVRVESFVLLAGFVDEAGWRGNTDSPQRFENIVRIEVGLNTLDEWREFRQRKAEQFALVTERPDLSESSLGKE